MGSFLNKCRKKSESVEYDVGKKQYSWDVKRTINPKEFTLEDLVDSELWRLPGTINGQQFIIKNCKNCLIYLLDHINTITLDECQDCKIVIGPVKGSIFIRNCKDSVFVVACGQFRTRDCRKLNVFLYCPTQPIVESSANIHFGCYQFHYTGIEGHFRSAGLYRFNNNWNNIHDFTPTPGETNWCILPDTMTILDYLHQPPQYMNITLSTAKEDSAVPVTLGVQSYPTEDSETCLVVFFYDRKEECTAMNFIKKFYIDRPDANLITTKQILMEPRDAEIVFGTSTFNRLAVNGPVIGLVYAGTRVIYSCQKIVDEVAQGPDKAYVSNDTRTAAVQAETFTNISTMTLKC